MIDGSKINKQHQQYGKSCLLSNYAVASNYFTGIDIDEYFIDYLKEFEKDFLNMSFICSSFDIMFNAAISQFEQVVKSNYSYFISKSFIQMNAPIIISHYHIICQAKGCSFAPVGIPGLKFMMLLQENSKQHSFQRAKSVIILELYDYKDDATKKQLNQDLNSMLDNEECIMNVFSTRHGHSFTIYKDNRTNKLFVHNTNQPSMDTPLPIDWMSSFDYGEILKYVRK